MFIFYAASPQTPYENVKSTLNVIDKLQYKYRIFDSPTILCNNRECYSIIKKELKKQTNKFITPGTYVLPTKKSFIKSISVFLSYSNFLRPYLYMSRRQVKKKLNKKQIQIYNKLNDENKKWIREYVAAITFDKSVLALIDYNRTPLAVARLTELIAKKFSTPYIILNEHIYRTILGYNYDDTKKLKYVNRLADILTAKLLYTTWFALPFSNIKGVEKPFVHIGSFKAKNMFRNKKTYRLSYTMPRAVEKTPTAKAIIDTLALAIAKRFPVNTRIIDVKDAIPGFTESIPYIKIQVKDKKTKPKKFKRTMFTFNITGIDTDNIYMFRLGLVTPKKEYKSFTIAIGVQGVNNE